MELLRRRAREPPRLINDRSIGKAIALALAEAGASVAVNYRERGEEASAVAETIRKGGGRAAVFGADGSLFY
jgi:3-oxoacyl-[acyl-carrier protein] reductase